MLERAVAKLGPIYILWMMIVTRFVGLIGGVAVVYYVQLTVDLTGRLRTHFYVVATAVVLLSVTVTVLLALWETQTLRSVMRRLHRGHAVPADMGRLAGREAVVFPVRHHFREALVVPLCCLPPVYVYLTWAADATWLVLVHITIATFMGIAIALSLTHFAIERLMFPVARHLISYGVVIDYEDLPSSRLQTRLLFSFTLVILITALMVGTLANQKVASFAEFPGNLDAVVTSLRSQTIAISACAVLLALLLSTLLARSISTRVQDIVRAMCRVEAGNLGERITAIATDEIGMLGRSFNKMVAQLEQNEGVIRELNVNLERKVQERTRQLEENKQELQHSYDQLMEHDRLKTEFFSNVSHELRTPLTLILSPVENLLEQRLGPLSKEQHRVLDITRRNALRLLELINDLLDFAKLEAGKPTLRRVSVDMNELVDELVSSASLLAVDRGIHLAFKPDSTLPPMMVDRDKLEKVVANLIANALKFTETGGRVDVTSGCKDGRLTIAVNDTGIGIAPENHERIFERFVQIDGSTSRQFEGTGLGLPLARRFAELHGGRLQVESEVGRGSRFWFTIPIIPSSEAPEQRANRARPTNYSQLLLPMEETAGPETAKPKSDSDTILIVDDSPDVLTVLKTVLGSDYNILEANDGRAGLQLAFKHDPDLIISDVMMPHVDGYEFCSRIKAEPKTARTPFVMLTAKAELSMKIESLEQGADDYLTKPFNSAELRARVRSLLKVRKLDRQLQTRNEELEAAVSELTQAQNQLVQSEKMRSLGQLAAGIAHEINNAINVVYNGIQPLRKKINRLEDLVWLALKHDPVESNGTEANADTLDDVSRTFASIIQLANVVELGSRRTASIVTDLKKFAHPGSGAHAMFDVNEGLNIALNLLANKMKDRVDIHTRYCDDGKICCSGAQLTQVFMNLLDNAQQAISGRGQIDIETERTRERMLIRFRDTGKGIPEDIQERIFDPFFTTKDVGVGTGLGLSISYTIVRGHGGSISVSSPPPAGECGTELTIALPLRAKVTRTEKNSLAETSSRTDAEASVTSPERMEDTPRVVDVPVLYVGNTP